MEVTRLSKHVIVPASPQAVWQLISDLDRLVEVLPNEDQLDYIGSQKTGLGTRTKWYRTSPLDGLVNWYEEITEWIPNERYTFVVRLEENQPPRVLGSLRLTPTAEGTDVEFYEERYYPDPDIPAIEKAMMEELDAIKDYFIKSH